MKRLIRGLIVSATVIVIIAVAVITSFSTRSAYADGENLGSKTTAYQKVYSAALASCIKSNAWRYDDISLSGNQISSKEARDLDWFVTNSFTDNIFLRTPMVTRAGGAIVEDGVTGEYSDGKIYCGEDNSKIVSKTIETLRTIDWMDIACDYGDNYATSGVFYNDPSEMTCKDMVNGDNSFLPNVRALEYYEEMVTDKVFNNNVPGGSLYSLTDLEKYYVYYNSFQIACATGNANFNTPDLAYQVILFNSSTGRFEKAGFSQKNGGNHLVYTFNGEAMQCSNLAGMLGYEDNIFFKAYHNEIMTGIDGPIANCEKKYNDELNKIKTYRDDYQGTVSVATNFRNKVAFLLKEVDDGGSVSTSELDGLPDLMNDALKQLNGADVFSRNAFEQALNAISALVELNYSEGDAPEEMRSAVHEWLGKVDDEITRAQTNLSTIDNFINQNNLDNAQAWKYDDDGLNMTCLVNELEVRKNEMLGGLPGIPEISGTFNPGDYIDNNVDINPGLDSAKPTCYNAASSLGWVVCPVLDLLGSITNGIYGYIEDNFLTIDAEMITDDATRKAWGDFQGFANICFVIFFTIVIFSQLTGIGLDNYNIKKILPRLIMVAVLVNLSFILCSVAVDLSNLLGDQINNIFLGWAIGITAEPFNAGDVAWGIASGMLTGGLTIGGAVIAFNTWEMWLFPFMLFLLGIVISLVFFFIILAVRQAAVILLLIMSPLAIVCYALPNTKKFFDVWKKGFVALLVVYPICGFIMGGGRFASTLLLSVGDNTSIPYNLVAMLLNIVPIFFIPSILRNSMVALGNIGTKISGFGGRMRQGMGQVRNTDGYKELQNQMKGRNAERFMRRDQFRQNHRILGAPGRMADVIGSRIRSRDNAIGRLAANMHDQKRTRMINRAIGARQSNQLAGYTAGSDFEQLAANAENAVSRRRINDLVKNVQDAHANVTDIDELQNLHAEALAALENDDSDANLAAVEAYQNRLADSDDGRRALYDNYALAISSGHTNALRGAGQHLMREHVRDIKSNNRDFWSLINDVAGDKDLHASTFTTFQDESGTQHYRSSYYDRKGISSYTAADLPRMDERSLDRLIEQASAGQLTKDDRERLESMTREAIMSDVIQVQGKIEDKFNDLRAAMGYGKVTKNDSGPIPIGGKRKGGKKNKGKR